MTFSMSELNQPTKIEMEEEVQAHGRKNKLFFLSLELLLPQTMLSFTIPRHQPFPQREESSRERKGKLAMRAGLV
jgi:hypothetical protein